MEEQGVHNASTTIPSTTLISKSLANAQFLTFFYQINHVTWGGSIFAVFHHSIEPVRVSTSQHSFDKVQCIEILWRWNPRTLLTLNKWVLAFARKTLNERRHSNESAETVKAEWIGNVKLMKHLSNRKIKYVNISLVTRAFYLLTQR